MKTLIALLTLLAAAPLLAQTKQIAHKSHSGTNASIQPDRYPDNFGAIPQEWIHQPEDTTGNGLGLQITWPTSQEEEPDTVVTAIEKPIESIPEAIDTTAPQAWPELTGRGTESTPTAGDQAAITVEQQSGVSLIALAMLLGFSAGGIGYTLVRKRAAADMSARHDD